MYHVPPPFLAVPEGIPVDKERGTCDPCCRPLSPDNVPLLDELEEDPNDRALLPPAEPPAEPTIGLKELTEQIQAVMQRLDERAHAAVELLSMATVNGRDEPTSFSSQLTPMQQLLEQTAESSSQAMPSPAPPVTWWSRIICDAILEGQWEPTGHMACPVARPVVFRDGNPVYEQHEWKILQQGKKNTVKVHGLKSESARPMLDWIHTADISSPAWTAPNLITIIKLLINIFTTLLLVCYCSTASGQAPSWTFIACACGIPVPECYRWKTSKKDK
ncbi:hypothetical protein DUI87_20789 [Hirundo rustica rustica]|uniref:Uncharacterized protein n=1 Tax=Hirundo rustica rustica TaxID=333673 RepID=A0A3M0JU28_HIRRU|nr:hypothetical protein DUI87_20789 [Hirundo rustica rustica]